MKTLEHIQFNAGIMAAWIFCYFFPLSAIKPEQMSNERMNHLFIIGLEGVACSLILYWGVIAYKWLRH